MADDKPKPAKPSSEIAGLKALAFFGVMVLFILGEGVYNPQAFGHVVGLSFSVGVAAWVLSTALPAGWLNLWRTVLLAVVLFGGVAVFIGVGR